MDPNSVSSALASLLNPAALASLQSTLTPAGLLSQYEAEQKAREAELARQTQAATAAASAASGEYSRAASAPPPQLDPLAASLPQLAGNVAGVLTGSPEPGRRAAASVKDQLDDLVTARLQNLQALRQNAETKSQAAEAAGNLEAKFKADSDKEKFDKAMQVLLEKQREDAAAANLKTAQDNRLAVVAATGAEARKTQEAKRKEPKPGFIPGGGYDISNMVRTTATGKKFLDIGGLTGDAKNAAIAAANAQKIPAPDPASVAGLKDVDRARRDIRKFQTDVLALVPSTPQARASGYLNRRISQFSQTDPARAAFKTWSDAAIPILRATAGSKNLRITQEQIKLAIQNLPTQNDTWATAIKKIDTLNKLLDNAEGPLIESDWSQIAPGGDEFANPALQRGK